ncbi:MAG: hypothetical protein LQ343_006821 [Gyalolechia ehrenbergii]|nr:MAG: hypothetical protein LQ343_006821 [Gyalolechia ehrenbergii]
MDLLQYLEELAVGVNRCEQEQEPTAEDLVRWNCLFGYPASEALDIIVRHRANFNTHRLSDEQWSIIKTTKGAEGYDRESYEHQLQLWSTNPSRPSRPHTSNSTSSYVFKLGGPFPDIGSLQHVVGVSSAEARVGYGEDGHANFARVDGITKRVIEEWLESQSPPETYRPTFILLSQSPKDLSNTSSHPTIGIDSTLPQHRMRHLNHSFAPSQTEYPVWYFFYGTLTDPQTLQKCISIPYLPELIPASIKGGRLRSWRGKYKALVDGPADAVVHGYTYRVGSADHEDCLRFRETQAYEVVRCRIFVDNVEGVMDEILGLTFRFGNPDELDVD